MKRLRETARALPAATVAAWLAAAVAAGCSGPAPVPRPEGWPRLEAYPASYSDVGGFALNDSAVVTESGDGRLTAVYPRYGATLYVTATTVGNAAERDGVIANRTERMALNTGGAASELTELTSEGGYVCRMLVTPRQTVTPVQFLAVGPTEVVSGAVFMASAATADGDSLRPTVDALSADILHALKQLGK